MMMSLDPLSELMEMTAQTESQGPMMFLLNIVSLWRAVRPGHRGRTSLYGPLNCDAL